MNSPNLTWTDPMKQSLLYQLLPGSLECGRQDDWERLSAINYIRQVHFQNKVLSPAWDQGIRRNIIGQNSDEGPSRTVWPIINEIIDIECPKPAYTAADKSGT